MKKLQDLAYENKVFCIRENQKWVAGIYHAGRTIKPVRDKNREISLMKLSNELFKIIISQRR